MVLSPAESGVLHAYVAATVRRMPDAPPAFVVYKTAKARAVVSKLAAYLGNHSTAEDWFACSFERLPRAWCVGRFKRPYPPLSVAGSPSDNAKALFRRWKLHRARVEDGFVASSVSAMMEHQKMLVERASGSDLFKGATFLDVLSDLVAVGVIRPYYVAYLAAAGKLDEAEWRQVINLIGDVNLADFDRLLASVSVHPTVVAMIKEDRRGSKEGENGQG